MAYFENIQGFPGEIPASANVERAAATFAQRKSKNGSGRHEQQVARVLSNWLEHGVDAETVDDLSVRDAERYAEYLNERAWDQEAGSDGGLAGTTAHHYYGIVHAFCQYLADRGTIDVNIAKNELALGSLPDESLGVDPDNEQQHWSPETREHIVRWADWRAESAADEGWMDPATAYRDRALVALLGYTGVRIAEVLADPSNERRNGLRWSRVDLHEREMTVLGKSQEFEDVPLLEGSPTRLQAHKRRQHPGDDSWPVFVTGHLPTLYSGLPDDVDASPETVLDLYREHELTPPALSTNGGRTIVERLSLESGIREEGEILKPHGARRGLGTELYRGSAEVSQSVLRHKSIETTHRSYNEDDTAHTRTAAEAILNADSRGDE